MLAENAHAPCAKTIRAIVCWGDDEHGQTCPPGGERFVGPEPEPEDVPLVSIGSGEERVCGLDEDENIHCWGNNEYHIDRLLRPKYRKGCRVAPGDEGRRCTTPLWHRPGADPRPVPDAHNAERDDCGTPSLNWTPAPVGAGRRLPQADAAPRLDPRSPQPRVPPDARQRRDGGVPGC